MTTRSKFKATPENIGLVVVARLRAQLGHLLSDSDIVELSGKIETDLTPLLKDK